MRPPLSFLDMPPDHAHSPSDGNIVPTSQENSGPRLGSGASQGDEKSIRERHEA